jgi:hypothetical protein
MNTVNLPVVALAWCGAVAAQAPSVIDFRGVPLGATEVDFIATNPAFICDPSPTPLRALADRRCHVHAADDAQRAAANFGGVTAKYIYASFIADRFGKLAVMITSSQFGIVAASLREKFGPPTQTANPEFKTQGGLTTNNEILTWRIGSGSVIATHFSGSITDGLVEYVDDQMKVEVERRQKDSAKASAKTL